MASLALASKARAASASSSVRWNSSTVNGLMTTGTRCRRGEEGGVGRQRVRVPSRHGRLRRRCEGPWLPALNSTLTTRGNRGARTPSPGVMTRLSMTPRAMGVLAPPYRRAGVTSARFRKWSELVRADFREIAEPIGGGHSTIHQEVAAGDEASIGSHQQRTDTADFVWRAGASGCRYLDHPRVASPRGPVSSSRASGVSDDPWTDGVYPCSTPSPSGRPRPLRAASRTLGQLVGVQGAFTWSLWRNGSRSRSSAGVGARNLLSTRPG